MRQRQQIFTITCLAEKLAALNQFVAADETVAEGDFLEAGDLDALALLHDPHEFGGFHQAVMSAGVEPGKAALEVLYIKLAFFKVEAVEIQGNRVKKRVTND